VAVMVTVVPTAPLSGLKLLMVGGLTNRELSALNRARVPGAVDGGHSESGLRGFQICGDVPEELVAVPSRPEARLVGRSCRCRSKDQSL